MLYEEADADSLLLAATHPIRGLPDDFRLYRMLVHELRTRLQRMADNPRVELPQYLNITWWAYTCARDNRIPGCIVSPVLTAVRQHEGLGRF